MPNMTPTANRPHGMRALLDARSEAQAVHGLEMRTELRFGEVAHELERQLGEAPGQMLILGVCECGRLVERFGTLLESARWPVLIVRREHEGVP
jgi:sulfate/thiosulfate transport system ATP-binding protein